MESPLNKKIQRGENRKAVSPKKAAVYTSLHEKVLALVQESNLSVREERHVAPRTALTVMDRALASLSSLSVESREAGALREVSIFISTATKTFNTNNTKHTDLLMQGHPLSALNASLTPAEYREKYATWLAADSAVNENVRSLVASAHAAAPGSVERDHAFSRLLVTKKFVPGYFKIDVLEALTAAFSSGNSSAARRARVALQWRDRKGRWVEMGRGVNFQYRLPNGSIQFGRGTYVGAGGDSRVETTSQGTSLVATSGLIEVSDGAPGLGKGLYAINSSNAAVFMARIPGKAAPEKPSFKDQLDADIPSLAEVAATRRTAPIGWTYQNGIWVSDDNYGVVPLNGVPRSLHRLDENGRIDNTHPAVNARNWADVSAAIEKDQPEFEKEIARLEEKAPEGQLPIGRIPGATARDVISAEDLLKMQQQRARENEAIDAGTPQQSSQRKPGIATQGEQPSVEFSGSITQQIIKLKASKDPNAKIEGTLENGVKYTIYKKDGRTNWRGESGVIPDIVTVDLSGRTFDARQDIKREMFRWDATDSVWRRTHLGLGPKEYSDPLYIQATLEKLNGGKKLAGKEAILPSAAEMRQDMKTNKWTPEILARRNGVPVEEINAVLDGGSPAEQSGDGGGGPGEPPSGSENSISKEAFNGLKNKIAEENKGGYLKSGLYFFHDLIGSDDGALSKDITFMVDEDEEFSPLGTISPDGTITWNDPSKQEDWAPALESALKSFTEGKDKFTKNKNTGYMEYDLGDRYVVAYGKDEDGNWFAEMNRFSRDGGLDSENSFPAKSEAEAKVLAEGLIDRYNDAQEWEDGDGPGTPPTGKEIYERRIATGDSLDKVAKDTGLTRLEVRRLESEYARSLEGEKSTSDFTDLTPDQLDKVKSIVGDDAFGEQGGFTFMRHDQGVGVYTDEIYVYKGSWEPGDKNIATILDDGGIDWESDALFDENSDSLRKAITGTSEATSERKPGTATQDENQPFDVSVAQKFLDERFAGSDIEIVRTTREGRNSYMILNIPDNELQDFKDKSGFDDFENKDNFTKLPDGTYKLYTDFSELNANLSSPVTGDGPGEPPSPDFTNRFKEVKELAESGSPTPQEFFDALFKDAKYRLPTSKELKDYGMPKDSKVFYVDEQDTFVQHSDGTWHNYDLDAPGESGGDKGTYDFFIDNFVGATDDLSLIFYRGAFIDDDLQLAVQEQRDGDGPGTATPFNYDNAKKIALDKTKTGQERWAALLDGAEGEKLSEFIDRNGPDKKELDPSIPLDSEVVIADGDGQNLTLRYPDGTYQYLDTGGYDSETKLITAMDVNEFDQDDYGIDDLFNKIFDPNEVAFTRGGFIDDARERAIYDGNNSGPGTPPTGKEIYERRIATGDSLDKVAKDTGLTRLEVRRLESEYARQNPDAANNARDVQDVNKALDFLDKHMDDKGLAEGPAIGISSVQDLVKEALDAVQNGDKATALDKLQEAYTIIDTRENVPDGVFPRGPNAGKALNALDDVITRLEKDTPQASERKPGTATQDEPFNYKGEDYDAVLNFDKVEKLGEDVTAYTWDIDITQPGEEQQSFIYGIQVSKDGTKYYTISDGRDGDASKTRGELFPDEIADYMEKYIKDNYGDASDPVDTDKPFVFSDKDYDPATFTFRKKEKVNDSNLYSWDVSIALPGGETNDYIYGIRVDDDGTVDYTTSDGMYGDASGNPGELFPIEVVEYMENYIKNKYPNDTLPPRNEDGPDEPPTPPSGGTPPKTPTPSQPSTPGLFSNFDVPNGAFKLRTADYEPEGRVDEASTNFTDDPKKLATRFTPQDLVAALSEALVGTSDDAAIAEILNANVDDAGDIPGAEDMNGVDIPRANMGQPSGAGRLEFDAGEEYVPMEALYNAVWEAGLDPNRVVANIYDSVNGNNNNLNRLIEAQGGVRSPEEAKLVDDITAEIRQIKSASPDSVSSANKKDKPLPEEDPLPGQLIENVPIDFENPDYYIPDSNAYIPSQPEVDENGFTDNPEILSRDYETADLIDQMIAGITDGSGAALLTFDDITVEVPVEALRDAIQLQDINTNDILLELKKESNDMSEEPEPAQPTGMPEQISNQKIKDKNDGEFELNLIKIDDMYEGALINKGNGRIQIVARDRDERVVKKALKDAGAHIKQAASGDEAMDDGVIPNLDSVEQPTLQAHSQMIRDLILQTAATVDDDTVDKIRDAINEKGLLDWSEADDAEIIEAIVEVAGPGILRQGQEPTPAAERRFPPTTGERQAIETPANPPAPRGPFGDSEGLNKASALIRSTFSRGFNAENKIAGIYENPYNGEGMIVVSLGDDADPIIFKWDQRDGASSFTTPMYADWYTSERGLELGWRAPTDAEQAALRSLVGDVEPAEPADSAGPPRDPSVDEPTPETPALAYPGPENRGYHPDNTTLDRAGKVMGKGTRIRASRDGRTGTVIAVQNIDNRSGERIPYVRVRFDDGTIAVRSALKVRATGDVVQGVPQGAPAPTPSIATNVGERLDAPVVNPGAVATDGSIAGVSNLGELPEALQGLGNPDAVQTDFAAWGDRAGEIAFAGRNRVSLDNLRKLNVEYALAMRAAAGATGEERASKLAEAEAIKKRLDLAVFDSFGIRDGVTFGNNNYTVRGSSVLVAVSGTDEASITRDHVPMSFDSRMVIRDSDGRQVGTVRRTVSYVSNNDGTPGYWKVKNDYMGLDNARDKKSGFATAYTRYMEDWYIANGIKEIHVQAAGGGGSYQGAFVWALLGFNWEKPYSAESELGWRLQGMRRDASTDQERAAVDRLMQKRDQAKITGGGLDLDKAPTPMELALVGWYPGATNWLGKKFMSENTGWMGIKRLDPAVKEQIQAINYDQIRRARSRIKDKLNRPDVSREFVLRANSDEFLASNQTLTPYIDEIRNAFQNNTSLATLSPAAKTVLSRWVGDQLMAGDSRTLPLSDVFKLRTALDAEAAADNPRASNTDFGVGNFLASASFEDISRNRLPGFEVRRLGTEESGYNDTYLVKHIDSGQSFYVKKDELARQYNIDPVRAEVEAGVLTRALGFQGMYETRANTADTSGDVLVMQQAGSSLPLASAPQSLASIFNNGGIQGPDGVIRVIPPRSIAPGAKLLDTLRTPEDAIRITLLDLIMNNQDRHNGNVLFAVDGTDPSRLRMLPIDHSLARMAASDNVDFESILSRDSDNVYTATIPVLLERMGQDALLDAFRNEAAKLVAALKEDSFSPKGSELAAIIKEHGSLTRFREKVEIRVNELLTPGTRTFGQFKDVLTPDYWNEG